jgi:hypothetical protein
MATLTPARIADQRALRTTRAANKPGTTSCAQCARGRAQSPAAFALSQGATQVTGCRRPEKAVSCAAARCRISSPLRTSFRNPIGRPRSRSIRGSSKFFRSIALSGVIKTEQYRSTSCAHSSVITRYRGVTGHPGIAGSVSLIQSTTPPGSTRWQRMMQSGPPRQRRRRGDSWPS